MPGREIGGRRLGGRGLGGRHIDGALGLGVAVAGGNAIQFSPSALLDSASVGDDVGTASISGSYTGAPSWSLSVNPGSKYSINSSTGLVEVAGSLSAGTDSITISVSGVTPAVTARAFNITVTASAAFPNNNSGASEYQLLFAA